MGGTEASEPREEPVFRLIQSVSFLPFLSCMPAARDRFAASDSVIPRGLAGLERRRSDNHRRGDSVLCDNGPGSLEPPIRVQPVTLFPAGVTQKRKIEMNLEEPFGKAGPVRWPGVLITIQ